MSWSPEERERRLHRARLLGRVSIAVLAVAATALVVVATTGGRSPLLLLSALLLVVAGIRTVRRLRGIDRALSEDD